MALIHSIQIENEKSSGTTVSSTRKSESRRYLACIVATTTEATVAKNLAAKAEVEANLSAAMETITALTKQLGMTAFEVQAAHEAACKVWFDARHEVREELWAQDGLRRYVTDAELAKVVFERHGLTDPFKQDAAKVSGAMMQMGHYVRQLDRWTVPVVGSQAVISWHSTVALAFKTNVEYVTRRGDTVEVRTDITITETKKRS